MYIRNKTLFGGHCLFVDSCTKKYDHKRSVFVGNLAYSNHFYSMNDYLGEIQV